ncbi:MAG: TlpA family protein disulfide reductase [Gaiellaceae bacterium]
MSTAFYIAFGALSVVVIFQTLVVLGLTRALHAIQSASPPPAEGRALEGQPAPQFSATALSGAIVDNQSFAGRLTALLFVSPDCGTCNVTLSELEALKAKTFDSVIVMCRSTDDKCAQLVDTYRITSPVIVDHGLELSRLFHVAGAPTAVLIDAEGHVQAYGEPMSPDELEDVLVSGQTSNGQTSNGQPEVVHVGDEG